MGYKITYRPQALITLEEIFEWSREHHPDTTEQFGERLFDHLEQLTTFPYVGIRVTKSPNVRRLSHPPLHIYYRVNNKKQSIEVLRFRHAARRPPR
ncbi:MAG TPA: type II toxin-antitoxin system RelE/ParE family toxin [Bryobacteraceae bacterium]|jgi:plasmid stabilization system protein ParE|nr:type II toxin-antitoxin system RelE/ParE family toxin [Bryobacteraceae bacterium]